MKKPISLWIFRSAEYKDGYRTALNPSALMQTDISSKSEEWKEGARDGIEYETARRKLIRVAEGR